MNDAIFKCLFSNRGNEKITKSFLENITDDKIELITTDCKVRFTKKFPKDKKMEAVVETYEELIRIADTQFYHKYDRVHQLAE